MEFRILGPLEVVDDGRSLPLGGARQRALLAALLLRANTVVPADRLLDEVWADDPPASGLRSVQVYISQLRKLLGDGVIETRAPGYLLVAGDGELDLERFDRLVDEARRSDPAGAAAKLREALALWRGAPLADFAYAAFAQTEIGRLEEARLSALEARIDADLELGRHAELVGELEALVAEHPLRERLRAQLMLALYRAGRQSEALGTYQDGSRRLREDLGLDPGRPLRDLEQAILRQDPALDLVPEVVAATEGRGIFVGRHAELATLVEGLEDAIAGQGRLFLLVGEPGIGKSRLADEVMRRARERGVRVVVGRCWEAGGAPAYWPWVQSLRSYVREAAPDALRAELGTGAAELAQILPELHDVLPGLPEPDIVDADAARFRLFDATSQFLRSASESRPILLMLDDLHAADTPSLLLLQFVARELASSRVLVIGALRDVDPIPSHALNAALAELTREPVTRRLLLAGLSEEDVAAYVELAASELAWPGLVPALYERTEGNPLFVGETVRLLALEQDEWDSCLHAETIPQSVRDVIARRLAHLSEDCNRVLALASVLGREFAVGMLARIAEVSEDELLDTLDEGIAARVVSGVPGASNRLRFAHVLIRDTLYDGLGTARRVRMHRLAVEALAQVYGDEPGPHLAELAHHAIAGSDFDRGLVYARRAGDRAAALLAYEEAARQYETALEALEVSAPADANTRCELLLSLGEKRESAGDRLGAKKAYLEAAGIARRLGLKSELAYAAAGYGGNYLFERAGSDDRLIPLLEEALEAVSDDDIELRVRLLSRLAGAIRDEHSRRRRDEISNEAVELARRTGHDAALAYALDARTHALIAPDTVDECRALGTELIEVAARTGNGDQIVHGRLNRFMANVVAGELGEAERDLEVLTGIAEQLRKPAHLWQARALRAELAIAGGRFAEAETLLPEERTLGERAQPELAIPVYRLQRYTLAELRGEFESVEDDVHDLVSRFPARPVFSCVFTHLLVGLGRLPEARHELARLAVDDLSILPFDAEWLYGMSLLAETSVAVEDAQTASVIYRLLLPWAALNAADHPEGIRGAVARYLGLLAASSSDWATAESHFEAAVAMNERMGARPWLARTQRDYGQVLLDRGDSARAAQLLAAAEATYAELGMTAR